VTRNFECSRLGTIDVAWPHNVPLVQGSALRAQTLGKCKRIVGRICGRNTEKTSGHSVVTCLKTCVARACVRNSGHIARYVFATVRSVNYSSQLWNSFRGRNAQSRNVLLKPSAATRLSQPPHTARIRLTSELLKTLCCLFRSITQRNIRSVWGFTSRSGFWEGTQRHYTA